MCSFIGTYECKIDDKGRIKIPLPLVKQFESLPTKCFVIKRSVFQTCLEVYPMKNWDKLMLKINSLNRFIKKNVDFIRMFTAGVKIVEIDSAERLQISKDLVQFANFSKEIVITSAGDIFEIWNKSTYERVITMEQENFSELAEEVMGKSNHQDYVS